DATEFVDDVGEAVEVDDRRAVEADPPGELDRGGDELEAAIVAGAVAAAEVEHVGQLVRAAGEARRLVGRRVHAGVARDRDQVDPVVRGRDVRDDHRVGVRAVVAGRTGIDAEQQDVDRALDLRAGQLVVGAARAEQVAGADGAVDLVEREVDEGDGTDAGQHHEGAEADQDVGPDGSAVAGLAAPAGAASTCGASGGTATAGTLSAAGATGLAKPRV